MASDKKIFKIKGKDGLKFTDKEMIELIKLGKVKPTDYIATNEMGMWIKVKDSIYQFYIAEDK